MGVELAYDLNLNIGDKINLMSTAFIATPLGGLPKQDTFIIKVYLTLGFYEFDKEFCTFKS